MKINLSKKIILLTLLICILTYTEAFARFKMQAYCSRLTADGMTKPSLFTVEFATGRELNQETGTSDYGDSFNYVIIWFPSDYIQSQKRFAIIKISRQVIMTDGIFRKENLLDTFKTISGRDEDGTFWEIKW